MRLLEDEPEGGRVQPVVYPGDMAQALYCDACGWMGGIVAPIGAESVNCPSCGYRVTDMEWLPEGPSPAVKHDGCWLTGMVDYVTPFDREYNGDYGGPDEFWQLPIGDDDEDEVFEIDGADAPWWIKIIAVLLTLRAILTGKVTINGC